MFAKIATLVMIMTLAIGGVGIVAASAQADTADSGTAVQTQTMTNAKYAGDVILGAQTQTRTATQTFARKGNLHQTPWAFAWGTQDDFVPGNPWTDDTVGTVEQATGFGFGGRGVDAPQGTIDD
jgi:hypothetical protein